MRHYHHFFISNSVKYFFMFLLNFAIISTHISFLHEPEHKLKKLSHVVYFTNFTYLFIFSIPTIAKIKKYNYIPV
jgi:hypothetical protein